MEQNPIISIHDPIIQNSLVLPDVLYETRCIIFCFFLRNPEHVTLFTNYWPGNSFDCFPLALWRHLWFPEWRSESVLKGGYWRTFTQKMLNLKYYFVYIFMTYLWLFICCFNSLKWKKHKQLKKSGVAKMVSSGIRTTDGLFTTSGMKIPRSPKHYVIVQSRLFFCISGKCITI